MLSGVASPLILLEFTVAGPAVTARSKNVVARRLWRDRVATAARAVWAGDPDRGDLEVLISEFSEFPTRRDRDNVAKPILDAMQGIAYDNDRQIKHLTSEWCDIGGSYKVRFMSRTVALALSDGHEFLWIRLARYVERAELGR